MGRLSSFARQMPVDASERRKAERRYRIAASASVRWKTTPGVWHQSKGVTRDISLSGLFVFAQRVPVPGTLIEISVQLPAPRTRGKIVTLRGRGTVLRLEPEESPAWGFAASITFEEPGGTRTFNQMDLS